MWRQGDGTKKKGGKVRKRKGKRWRKEGRKEVEEGKIIGRGSKTCNEKGLMNRGGDKRKKTRKKQSREKRKKVRKRRREEKRDRTRSKRERELCRIQAYQNHVCANLFHFLDTSIRTTGCWTAS